MVDQMMRKMVTKDRIKKTAGVVCILLVVGLLAYELLYIRVYDASIPFAFPSDYTEDIERSLQNLASFDESKTVAVTVDKQASGRILISPDTAYDTFFDQYAVRFSEIGYQLHILGDRSVVAISEWKYDHHKGLYKTLFDSNSGFLNPSAVDPVKMWYEDAFPTKEEQQAMPYYRYFIHMCVQKEDVRYNMDIFCKKPELLDAVLPEIVNQINLQADAAG